MPRTASKPKKGAEIASKEHPEPPALERLREEIKSRVGNEAQNIVKSLIEEARKGNCAPAKYLFEMVGLYPAAVQEQQQENPEEDSLARTLLRRLGLPEEPILESEVTKDREVPTSANLVCTPRIEKKKRIDLPAISALTQRSSNVSILTS